jgi:S1-C subfamily serine protease
MKHEHHRNILYGIIVTLLVLQIVSFVVLSSQASNLFSAVENEKAESSEAREEIITQFTELLGFYSSQNQQNIEELSSALSEQGDKFEKQLDLVKSTKDDFSGIIDQSLGSVVGVRTDRSIGTGFVVNGEGYIVTNYHVVGGANQIAVLTNDQEVISAEIVGGDSFRDIALLKVDKTFDELEIVDSDDLQVGKKVIAIGNPLGLSFSVSEGIISGLNRAGPNGLEEYVQTDVGLNPGNSGGPLIDTSGRVVGINNFKIGGSEGLGFALEGNAVKEVVNSFTEERII